MQIKDGYKLKETSKYKVIYTEYERGCGHQDWLIAYCDTLEEARKLERECNSRNTEPTAPDYYIIANVYEI